MAFHSQKSKNPLRQPIIYIPLLLTVITAAVYWQVHMFDFINYDDSHYVYDNTNIQGGFKFDHITWAFTTGHASNWHPLTWLSHMLDFQFFGMWAGGHHLTSLLFHIVNSLLLFVVFRKMTGNIWQSAFMAALFALHPLHVQSVAWVSERKDVLSGFFWMLTMLSYIHYVRHPGWSRYALVLIFYIFGLMSKPMVVTLPFVMLLLDYWPLARLRLDRLDTNLRLKIARLLREKIPLFILTAASAVITFYFQQKDGVVHSFSSTPLIARLQNALTSYLHYIIKTIYPLKLAIFYPFPNKLPWWELTASVVILSAVSWTAIKLMHRKPWFIVGWLWFLGTLIPVIGLVQVGMQSMADRYMYLPMIGLLIPFAWGIPELLFKWRYRKNFLLIAAVCVLISLSWVTRFQLAFWTDTNTLFNRALAVTKNNYFAYNIVGEELAIKGDYAAAEKFFLTALRIKPDDVDAMIGLGQLNFKYKNYDQALNYYQKSLGARPDNDRVLKMIGEILYKSGNPDKALDYYAKALILKPSDPDIYNKLGTVFFSKNMFDKAREKFETAVRLNPKFDEAYYNLGLVASKQGKSNEAIINYQKAIKLNPDYADAHASLANILFSKGDMIQAFNHYSETVRINPDDAAAHYNIGVILFQQQKIKEADEHFYQALKIDNTYEKAKIALSMTKNILKGNH